MEEAELIVEDEETVKEEEEEEMVKEEKWNDMDLAHSEFSMAELRTKLYTIEEESSENDEESEEEAEDWREINRLQGLSELQRYFLLLADGQQEFSKQC